MNGPLAGKIPGQASRACAPDDAAYAASGDRAADPGPPAAPGASSASSTPAASGAPGASEAPCTSTMPADTLTVEQLRLELERLEGTSGYNIEAAYDRAGELERIAEELGEVALELRARLIQIDVRVRGGELTSVVSIVWQINQWAVAHGVRPLLSRSHLLMARVHRDLGDLASALEHTVASVEALDEDTPARIRIYHLMKLADILDETGSLEASRERYQQAERLAATIDVERHVTVLNNIAYAEYEAGQTELAWAVIERMLALSTTHKFELDATVLDTVARVQIALGRYDEAVMTAQTAIQIYDSQEMKQADALPEALLTLAVAQRLMGTTKDAQESLDLSRTMCDEHGYLRIRLRVHKEQAELHAATGDYRKAFEAYKAYHAFEKELASQQREAQARTRQAMFEATEARQEAELFREQARRDPLTGLRNRRYVDEHLPALIAEATATGGAVTVAIVDLDHFKRINDTCSHDVGDQVLVAVAEMLDATPSCDGVASGFAARMGGEEFLLVLTGMTPTEAVVRLEDLRASVAARSWRSLTGDLPVTVSIGVTASQPHSTQAELLALADANLYTAKHKGRNRVCATSGTALTERRRHRDLPVPPHVR
ncbi:tetratricopeptide repeat-containing diguanylate cyclase [Planobispora takensis]|uniref:GGDEF domain-containing protein n=1 Tax=Planobispora takensis TaxID=1367882 RepID=A0A8J3WTA0_9ACTN|nr:GGDEF domain-containing protein [Planobispora takensis]GIH98731.1 hypothetical protein Pta02_07400 [Planobispora takensis]